MPEGAVHDWFIEQREYERQESRRGRRHAYESIDAEGSSDLPALLSSRGIDTIVVTGTVTFVCVEGTVRDAATRGWRVIVAADGCSARRDQDHNASLRTMYRTFSDVRSTAEIVDLLETTSLEGDEAR